MFTDVGKSAGEILGLLKTRNGPVSIREVMEQVGAPRHTINIAIGMLVRGHWIGIESRNGENFVIMISQEASAVT